MSTINPPPPDDPSKSPIENTLELTALEAHGPDIYTNTRPLWHPSGARGIYGGAVIAQCLSAAQLTLPFATIGSNTKPTNKNNNGETPFFIHSMHCYFVLAGDATLPVLYHVERVRDGRSFVTRTVQARQRGKAIFTTTCSFVREGSGGMRSLEHGVALPLGVEKELERDILAAPGSPLQSAPSPPPLLQSQSVKAKGTHESSTSGGSGGGGKQGAARGADSDEKYKSSEPTPPFVVTRLPIRNSEDPAIHRRFPRQWLRARGTISPSAGPYAHSSALAYISDSWFIGTAPRVHGLGGETPLSTPASSPSFHNSSRSSSPTNPPAPPKVGMMVSLDHTIYFHNPRATKCDEWMYSEMGSPWTGHGRGLVVQRIWNREGVLLATCVQEGLVRLKGDEEDGGGEGGRKRERGGGESIAKL